jgi:hypothetical protein
MKENAVYTSLGYIVAERRCDRDRDERSKRELITSTSVKLDRIWNVQYLMPSLRSQTTQPTRGTMVVSAPRSAQCRNRLLKRDTSLAFLKGNATFMAKKENLEQRLALARHSEESYSSPHWQVKL